MKTTRLTLQPQTDRCALWTCYNEHRGPILVLAHSDGQFEHFRKSQGIPRTCATLIRPPRGIDGINVTGKTIYILEDWERHMGQNADHWDRIVQQACYYHAFIVRLPESYTQGRELLCPNDNDLDGHCHLCVSNGCAGHCAFKK